MAATLKIVGIRQFQTAVRRAGSDLPDEVERNVRKAGEIIIGQARREFVGERTRARKKGRPVTSPRDKLGQDIGRYWKQISQTIRRRGKKITAEIGPVGLKYPVLHEFGIGRMPQRQVITPAVQKTATDVFDLIGQSFKVIR